MALVAPSSSSAALVKAVVLPLVLALLAVAVATGSSSAGASEDGSAAVTESGGLFSESSLGRKLLSFNLCGTGTAPDFKCKVYLPFAKNATCCKDTFGNSACYDVGGILIDKCGSCTTKCTFGSVCCSGVCANLLTSKNNCGFCGNKCRGTCTLGFCNY